MLPIQFILLFTNLSFILILKCTLLLILLLFYEPWYVAIEWRTIIIMALFKTDHILTRDQLTFCFFCSLTNASEEGVDSPPSGLAPIVVSHRTPQMSTNMEHEKRMRREIANSNERRRMQSINAGFQNLRTLIPHHEGEKLSKVRKNALCT